MSLDSPGARSEHAASEDLLVTSLSVQGGEAVIGDEKTAFARILMSGMRLQNGQLPIHRVKTRQVTLLKLDLAEELTEGLREIMNHWARSSPTPVLPARGTWSWHSEPLPSDDILVAEVKAGREEIRTSDQATPIVRLDFTGAPLEASTSGVPPVRMPAAIFTVPRHVQSLISSLKKCTLALRPQIELQYLGFSIPTLDTTSPEELQSSRPQQ